MYTPTRTVKSPGKFIVLKASATITLSPTVGPPTSSITVTGSGFGKNKAVAIYFDTSDEALAGANGQGAFSINITVPASAVPGTHWVSAVQRYNGLTAQAPFLVQTNWAEYGYNLQHSGTNPYENVLNPSNVSGLGFGSSAPTGDSIASSPVVVNGVVYVGSADNNLYAYTLPVQQRVQPPARPNPAQLHLNLNLPLQH